MKDDNSAIASDIQAMTQMFGEHWKHYQEIQHTEHVKTICQRWPILTETEQQRQSFKLSGSGPKHSELQQAISISGTSES